VSQSGGLQRLTGLLLGQPRRRQLDERIGFTGGFAEAVDGPRATGLMEHGPTQECRTSRFGRPHLGTNRHSAKLRRPHRHTRASCILLRSQERRRRRDELQGQLTARSMTGRAADCQQSA
jgi:hypothetical protein